MSWYAIACFRLVVADLDAATEFYCALGFVADARRSISGEELALLGVGGAGWRQSLTLGRSRLDLDCFETRGRPYPTDADAASLCFQHLALVTSDAEAFWRKACAAGATRISRDGPVTLPASAGGVIAVKFRDLDKHPLELLQFPDGAAAGWPGRGLLGIDHTAISVADVATSCAFYEARGLRQGRPSLNQGPTQEALDGFDSVQVQVVPLQPRSGPAHLELLGYIQPQGHTFERLNGNDIAATRIVWRADEATLLRDPDGHLQQLEAG